MKIKIYKNRSLCLDSNDFGTAGENLATTLLFEFPEYVEKKWTKI